VITNPFATPELWVRFYGRFVFVEARDRPGQLTALAVKMDHKPADSPDHHQVFLTVAENNVDRVASKNPTFRITGTDLVPIEAVRLMWNLELSHIDIPGPDDFEWMKSPLTRPLADLNHLIESTEPQLSAFELTAKAVITLHTGTGLASHLTTPFKLMRYEYVSWQTGEPVEPGRTWDLADMVQVSIKMPTRSIEIGFDNHERVVIDPKLPTAAIILSFSNLCTRADRHLTDMEFVKFYEILENRLDDAKLKVPRLTNVISLPTPAPTETAVEPILPFGDCFLGASIVVASLPDSPAVRPADISRRS